MTPPTPGKKLTLKAIVELAFIAAGGRDGVLMSEVSKVLRETDASTGKRTTDLQADGWITRTREGASFRLVVPEERTHEVLAVVAYARSHLGIAVTPEKDETEAEPPAPPANLPRQWPTETYLNILTRLQAGPINETVGASACHMAPRVFTPALNVLLRHKLVRRSGEGDAAVLSITDDGNAAHDHFFATDAETLQRPARVRTANKSETTPQANQVTPQPEPEPPPRAEPVRSLFSIGSLRFGTFQAGRLVVAATRNGITARELAEHVGGSPKNAGNRLQYLEELGLLENTGEVRRRWPVWRASDELVQIVRRVEAIFGPAVDVFQIPQNRPKVGLGNVEGRFSIRNALAVLYATASRARPRARLASQVHEAMVDDARTHDAAFIAPLIKTGILNDIEGQGFREGFPVEASSDGVASALNIAINYLDVGDAAMEIAAETDQLGVDR